MTVPTEAPAYVRAYLETPSLIGERHFLVVSLGPKWAKLLYVPLLEAVNIARKDFDKITRIETLAMPDDIKKRIRWQRKRRTRMGSSVSQTRTNEALAVLSPNAPILRKPVSADGSKEVVRHRSGAPVAKPSGPGKTEQLLTLLQTPEGASMETIVSTFGWQSHSARAVISGLRKAGHAVERAGSTYRIKAKA